MYKVVFVFFFLYIYIFIIINTCLHVVGVKLEERIDMMQLFHSRVFVKKNQQLI